VVGVDGAQEGPGLGAAQLAQDDPVGPHAQGGRQQVIAEYDGAGVIQNRYVPGLGLNDVVTSYDAGGNRTWLLSDERRSVVALTDGSGAATAINTYDEYGVPSASNAGRFQYTGQMWLPDAQLYHYRARAYAPQIGRFMQPDPMGYAAGANIYAYVGGDPVNWFDPLGLRACKPSEQEDGEDLPPVDVCGKKKSVVGGGGGRPLTGCVDVWRLRIWVFGNRQRGERYSPRDPCGRRRCHQGTSG
jgi:RHS repeat-associated protein